MYSNLDRKACLLLFGTQIQLEGELIVWFEANLLEGTRRWAAIYKYLDAFYMQTTDAGQGSPYQDLSSPLVDVVSGVDLLSMKIGTGKLQANEFIQTVRAELDAAEYPMSGLDLQMIETS